MIVFTTNEGKDGNTYFTEIGKAYENSDGSISVVLNANPISGRLYIRDAVKKKEPPKEGP